MALRDVNLVPAQVLHRRSLTRHIVAWGLAYLLLLGCCAGVYVGVTRVISPRDNAGRDEALLRKRLAETIAEIQKKTAEVEQMAFVRRMSRPGDSCRALDWLAANMGAQTWLTDFLFQAANDSGASLVLTGFSASNEELGVLINQITSDRMFANVMLKTSDEVHAPPESSGLSPTLVAFTIQVDIRGE